MKAFKQAITRSGYPGAYGFQFPSLSGGGYRDPKREIEPVGANESSFAPRPGLDLNRDPTMPRRQRPRMTSYQDPMTQESERSYDAAYDITQPQYFRGRLVSDPLREVTPVGNPFNWKKNPKYKPFVLESATKLSGEDVKYKRKYEFILWEDFEGKSLPPTYEWMEVYEQKTGVPEDLIFDHWVMVKEQLRSSYEEELQTMREILRIETQAEDLRRPIWNKLRAVAEKISETRRLIQLIHLEEDREPENYENYDWEADSVDSEENLARLFELAIQERKLRDSYSVLMEKWDSLCDEALQVAFHNSHEALEGLRMAVRYREGWYLEDQHRLRTRPALRESLQREQRKNINLFTYGEHL